MQPNGMVQYYYEPSVNDQERDTNPNTEYGIDIRVDTGDYAPIWSVQLITITGSGRILDGGVDTDNKLDAPDKKHLDDAKISKTKETNVKTPRMIYKAKNYG